MFFNFGLELVKAYIIPAKGDEPCMIEIPGIRRGIFAMHPEIGRNNGRWRITEQGSGLACGRPFPTAQQAAVVLDTIKHIEAAEVTEIIWALEPHRYLFNR